MGRFKALAGVAVALIVASCAPLAPAAERTMIFRHVAVLPMDRDVLLPDQRVVIRGDRIWAVEADRAGPSAAGAVEIDGRGLVLMPGLVDFHTHSEGWEELPGYVSGGVTTIASLGGEALSGRWREGGDLPMPNQIAGSEILDGNPPTNRRFQAVDAAHAAQAVDEQVARGAEFIKIYGRLADPARTAVIQAARARGLVVGGHIPRGADLRILFAQGYGFVAHGEEYFQYLQGTPSDERLDEIARTTADAGAVVIPNLVGYTAMPRHAVSLSTELERPGVAGLSPAVYQEWLPRRNRYANRPNPQEFARASAMGLTTLQRLTAALHRRGVLLVAGTDAPIFCLPQSCLHEDIRLLGAAGLGPYEALRAATVNAGTFAARIRRTPPDFGIVRPGMRADLILLAGDPRTDLARLDELRGVMVAGRWWTAAELAEANDQARDRVADRHAVVDQYERLIAGPDLAPLFGFLDRAVGRGSETLNSNVLIFDALELEQAGRAADAIALLEHAAPTFRRVPGIWNQIGRLKATAGDREGARRAWQQALHDRASDAMALAGLEALPATPSGAAP